MRDLTAREAEVMDLVCEGMSNREIAERLGKAESTVKHQVENSLRALDARNRTQAAVIHTTRDLTVLASSAYGAMRTYGGVV